MDNIAKSHKDWLMGKKGGRDVIRIDCKRYEAETILESLKSNNVDEKLIQLVRTALGDSKGEVY